ncbi:ribokinase [Shimazuella sp. AN120528]|uniref:ribokinase n=1 Tax=Shimazuella soli TaxID=1892854 RepID=UPI001F0D3943|nr:ribokinase [Shimazuella soli]MCH5584298.1 ribokinase [Shimazuella soli]
MSNIVIIGSMNMDLVVITSRRAHPGETIFGEEFLTVPGGKGANQAVAAARLGAKVHMVGAVGNDSFGASIFQNLKKEGINTTNIQVLSDESTGTAHITVAEGDNTIIVIPAANARLSVDIIQSIRKLIEDASIVILQLEVPLTTVAYAIDLCNELQTPVLLNPAPAQALPKDMIDKATYLTPNEHEAKILFPDDELEAVLKKYPNKLIVTEGEKGVRFYDGEQLIHVPARNVEVVDTTGAGDTFNAAFAIGLTKGYKLKEAIEFANLAAGLSVGRLGAQAGMPTLEQLIQVQGEMDEKNRRHQ